MIGMLYPQSYILGYAQNTLFMMKRFSQVFTSFGAANVSYNKLVIVQPLVNIVAMYLYISQTHYLFCGPHWEIAA